MKTKLKQDPNKPEVPAEILAQSIETVAAGMRKLTATRLSRRALHILIRDACNGVGIAEIEAVLNAVENLDRRYLKKAAK